MGGCHAMTNHEAMVLREAAPVLKRQQRAAEVYLARWGEQGDPDTVNRHRRTLSMAESLLPRIAKEIPHAWDPAHRPDPSLIEICELVLSSEDAA